MLDTNTGREIDFEALRQIAGEDGLVLESARLEEVAVDGLTPRAIVRPETEEQAAEFLKYADSNGLKVAIRGGGTKTGLGNPLAALDLVLSTERLNSVLEYSPADLMIGVQAGANLQEIQNQLELNGQFLPIDSPLASRATIGGAVACNTSGPARLMYGPARDWLIGVRFALPEGMIAHGGGRVVKNVAGYDLMKVFTGSLGTLGLILDMNFKLMPLPRAAATLLASFESAKTAGETALKIIDAGLFPSALTVLDSAVAQRLELTAPENGVLLLVEVRNTSQAVERQVRDITALCQQQVAKNVERIDERDLQKQLWRKVSDFAYDPTLHPEKSFTLKAGVLPNQTAEILELAKRTAAKNGLEISGIFQAGHGLVYLIGTYEDEEAARQTINTISRHAEVNQGSVAAERIPLSLKPGLGDIWGKALTEGEIKLMRGIKSRLDPRNTLNPARFVAGI
jgi:glycolate oxidase FAD binding subunit